MDKQDMRDERQGLLPDESGRLLTSGCSSRSGVALILVIGLLALMVVMGVTFSIFMRTERVAAGNFRNDVVARQLLHVALNRAIAAIDTDLGGKAYPAWYYLESGPTNGALVRGVTNAPALDWIPRAALGSNPNPQPRWLDLANGLPNMIEGRVGFVVVNCSGLLDANKSGMSGVSRGLGTNVNEIQISACPEVVGAAQLVADRPYETIQELGKVGQASGALSQPVANFVSFSSFPTGYVGGTNFALVDLSGDEVALMARQASILSGLRASGIEAGQEGFVFSNLLDYVDADIVSRDLGTAYTESVPMFNEIVVSNAIVFRANGTFDIRYRVFAEWFYPFVKPSANTYWIEYNVRFERTGSTPLAFPIPADRVGVVLNSDYASNAVISPAGQQWLVSSLVNANYSSFTGAQVTVKAKISLKMHANDAAGPVVDAAPYPSTTTLDFTLPTVNVPLVASALTTGVVRNAEVIDPRFNWDSAQWFQRSNFNTLYATNARTLLYLQSRDTDGYADMFVADRPLKTVSELTYLLRGGKMSGTPPLGLELDYWNTIRLYDSSSAINPYRPVDRVLDNFFIPTGGYGKGFVNPNSGMTSVLTAVFLDMPVSDYPDGPSGFTLNANEAAGLSAFWANTNQNPWRCNFTNLSDIGRATNVFGVAPLAGLSPFQRESIFRNTSGLLNTRQQYFMILLFSQATRTVPQLTEKSVVAGVRGIAEVWRDALPNAEGVHPYSVRMFRVLNNE